MSRHVALQRLAIVHGGLADGNSGNIGTERVAEFRSEGTHRRVLLKHHVFPAIRAALGSARGFRIGEVFHQKFSPRSLRRHSRTADRERRKKAHDVLPSWMALRRVASSERARLVA